MLKFFTTCFLVSASSICLANSSLDVNEFIDSSYTPVNDCPAPEIKQTIDSYLSQDGLSSHQTFELITRKTHAMICARDYNSAQTILQGVLADESADRAERYYLSALYQYGFIYDVQENEERCNYYLLAKDSAGAKHIDIKTSASMNYASSCTSASMTQKLAILYRLLEEITRSGDKAGMAHAHNSIGLFYGNLGYHKQAADQYLKAAELSRDIYTNENRLTILTSALTILMSSNDMKRAYEVMDEFIEINKEVNTVQTNFLQYYSEAGLYIRTGDYEKLAVVLEKWDSIRHFYEDSIAQGLFTWYAAELCLAKQDAECLTEFLALEQEMSESYLNHVKKSIDYARFKVQAYLFMKDFAQAKQAFEYYDHRIMQISSTMTDAQGLTQVIEFQNKIEDLEVLLQEQRQARKNLLIGAIALLITILVIAFWVYRSKFLKAKSRDAVTGLLTNAAVIEALSKLAAPGPKRTNALAIFDIANFTEVNLTVGASKGDFVLKQIANTFKNITRSSDILGVFGPGQFILCLADIEEDAAQAFFERVKEALSNTFAQEHNNEAVSVDSSMSIYYGTENFSDINEILDNMLLSLSMKSK